MATWRGRGIGAELSPQARSGDALLLFRGFAPMRRKNENPPRALFSDPVSGNIQWREVESLLHHLGATTEPLAKARLRVRLNGVEGTLHRPHHGDALGRQDILHIREYLAHARATPSQYEAIRKG